MLFKLFIEILAQLLSTFLKIVDKLNGKAIYSLPIIGSGKSNINFKNKILHSFNPEINLILLSDTIKYIKL